MAKAEVHPSFSSFLKERDIFSQLHVDKLGPTLDNDDQTRKLSRLADFFRCMSPSDCYDLALRLYLAWNKAPEVKEELKIQKGFQKLGNLIIRKLKQESFGKLRSYVISLNAEKNKARSSITQQSNVKQSINKEEKSVKSVYEALYERHQRKSEKMSEIEEMKRKQEVEECTFQPKLFKSQGTRSSVNVFDRLHKDMRKEKREINEKIKMQKEMQGCTFHPETLKGSMTERSRTSSPNVSMSQTFDRLYKHKEVKQYHFEFYEQRKKMLEVKDCTFHPKIHRKDEPTQEEVSERIERLHKLHSEREKNLMKKKFEKSVEEENRYSFKPSLIASPTLRNDNKEVYDRLLEWQNKKKREMEIKAIEKAHKEQKMSEEVGTHNKKRSSMSQERDPIHQRLYHDGARKKVRDEVTVKQVLKDMGASFRPKINHIKYTSNKRPRSSMRSTNSTNVVSFQETNLNLSTEGDSTPFPRKRSPSPQKMNGKVKSFGEISEGSQQKNSLEDSKTFLSANSETKSSKSVTFTV